MYQLGIVKRNIQRADRAAVDKLAAFGVATIHEAMGRVGLMKPYMRPIYPGANVAGTAVTVLLHPGDNWMMHVVAEQLQPGQFDVVFADPPYATDAAARLVAQFRVNPFARVLSIEHPSEKPMPGDDTRRYGDTAITLIYAP